MERLEAQRVADQAKLEAEQAEFGHKVSHKTAFDHENQSNDRKELVQ